MNFAYFLRDCRALALLSQRELGAAIGVDRTLVSRWENGLRRIGKDDLERLVAVLQDRSIVWPGQVLDDETARTLHQLGSSHRRGD